MSDSSKMLATIDLGSNSFHLLIAKILADGTIYPIDQIKESVRLADGLDEQGNLTAEKQFYAIEVLSRFKETLGNIDKNQIRAVGTSTLRVAKNTSKFLTLANKALGVPIEVISGAEEARLTYIGGMHSLAYSDKKRLVIDIGGGSTEFVIGSGYDPMVMESLTMGCVSFSKAFFGDGQLSEENFQRAILTARSRVQTMEHTLKGESWSQAVGTSGTAKAIYTLCLENGLGTEITLVGMDELRRRMIKCKTIKNLKLEGLKEDRKAVIAGGLSIMIAAFYELGISSMIISGGALREGVMYDYLIGRDNNHDLRDTTVQNLRKRYLMDITQGNRVADLALYLFNKLDYNKYVSSEQVKLLRWAGELYEIGLLISHNDHHKHGAYILENSDFAGFSRPTQSVLANLVRAHRGGVSKLMARIDKIYQGKQRISFIYALIALRISVICNRARIDCDFKEVLKVKKVTEQGFELHVNKSWYYDNPLASFSLEEEVHAWKNFDMNIVIVLS